MPVYCLKDLDNKENTLSNQLKRLTGDDFSSVNFHSHHDPSSVTPAGVVVHKKTGKQIFVPFTIEDQKELREDYDCLKELRNIMLLKGGIGAYYLGDVFNPLVSNNGSILNRLEIFGLAKRTGNLIAGRLGGESPEVSVTELGQETVKGYLRKLGRDMGPLSLLENGRIPRSVLVAAEAVWDLKYNDICFEDILKNSGKAWNAIKKTLPGLETYDDKEGIAHLEDHLEKFHKLYGAFAISPVWFEETGTQVRAMIFDKMGNLKSEGIVNLYGPEPKDRDSFLKVFRENQTIIEDDFYKDRGLRVVITDSPANQFDPLYKSKFTGIFPSSDFSPDAKIGKNIRFSSLSA
jgi:hypothetical protein